MYILDSLLTVRPSKFTFYINGKNALLRETITTNTKSTISASTPTTISRIRLLSRTTTHPGLSAFAALFEERPLHIMKRKHKLSTGQCQRDNRAQRTRHLLQMTKTTTTRNRHLSLLALVLVRPFSMRVLHMLHVPCHVLARQHP